MSRPLRIQIEDGWYHVTSRGTERRVIFTDDRERKHFLELLEQLRERYRIIIHSYVLMANHYHLIVETPEGNLSAGMQWLNTSYSMWFNRRHDRVGPLLQGRYKGVWIENSGWAYEASMYVHLNPVRIKAHGLDKRSRRAAGEGRMGNPPSKEEIGERLRKLRAYEWSSYRSYAGYAKGPEWLTTGELLKRASRRPSEQHRCYREEVCGRITEGVDESLGERLKNDVALGSEQFRERIKTLVRVSGREYSGKRQVRRRCSFEDILDVVEELKGEKWREFARRRGSWGKGLVLWGARQYTGMTLVQIGKKAGGMDYTAVAMAIKRFEERIKKRRKWRDYQRYVAEKCEK